MRKTLAILIDLFVAIASVSVWLYMVFAISGDGPLTAGGLFSLKFFTTLSNLFNGAVCFVAAACLLARPALTPRLTVWKLSSTATVGLTFLTVTFFFGPAFGFATVYWGTNFWFHLLLPVLSVLNFMLLEPGERVPFRKTGWALVPMAIYAVGYLGNILLQGVGEWPHRHDFYGFLTWGWPIGVAITSALVLATWGLAILMWKTKR